MQHQNKSQIISVTNRAISRIKLLLALKKEFVAIRIKVKPGGCSGLSYDVEYARSKDMLDEEVVCGGVCIFVDKRAVLYLIGSVVDYVEEKFKSGFVFENPREKARCGCGKSFNVGG